MFSEKSGKIWMWVGIILFIVGVTFFLWQDLNFDKTQQINSQKFGEFGSFIGGLVGSIWAFAGVILFYVALTEQRKDMKINQDALNTQIKALEQQIEEFELQRKELELTREVFVEQSKTMNLQRFESTFFNSLNLLNSIIENITVIIFEEKEIKYGKHPVNPEKPKIRFTKTGRDCFVNFYTDLSQLYYSSINSFCKENNLTKEELFKDKDAVKKIVKASYKETFSQHQAKLGHYFRTIYNIIKLVDEKNIENPKYYTNLVRAQLSSFEHLLLFYNCLSEFGEEKFYPLIVKYSLLDNIPKKMILDEIHKEFYPEKAYE